MTSITMPMKRIPALSALALASLIALTGCSDDAGADVSTAGSTTTETSTEYVGEASVNDIDENEHRRIVLEGSTITVSEYECNEIDDSDTSVGQLNEARSQVVWTQEGSFSGSDTVSIVDGAISIDEQTYVESGSDQAKELLNVRQQNCSS
ncbi:hypothetical protein AQ436_10555 [Arthrobacter sp. EpRS66]|nr:hypothetical protein AQ436_10555 [Arthrobacter sp. EpRS66]